MDGQPCDFTGKTKTEKIIMRIMFFVFRIFGIFLLFLAPYAQADGGSPLDRRHEICVRLGYTTSWWGAGNTCDFQYEGPKYLTEVTVTVDDDTDEPNKPASTQISSGMLQLKFLKTGDQFADIFIPIKESGVWATYWYEEIWAKIVSSGTCITPECTVKRDANPEYYSGVSEYDLYDLKHLREHKLPYQVVDNAMQAQIQRKLNTQAVPVVTDVKSVKLLAENKDNSGATVFRAVVIIQLVKDLSIQE